MELFTRLRFALWAAIACVAMVAAAQDLTWHSGLLFDPVKRELLAADGQTVLDRELFRAFPHMPTQRGVDRFKDIFSQAIGRGYVFSTTVVQQVDGRLRMLVTVTDDDGDVVLADYPLGETLEVELRHRSRQAAINHLVAVVNNRSNAGIRHRRDSVTYALCRPTAKTYICSSE